MPNLIPDTLRDRVVTEMLESYKNLAGWANAKPDTYRPVYDNAGEPSYLEVTIKDENGAPKGYALISATEDDIPVLELSESATPPSQQLAAKVGAAPFRMVYYGAGYISAEDASGNLLADVGQRPLSIPRDVRVAYRGEGGNVRSVASRPPPPRVARGVIRRGPPNAASYTELRQTFVRPRPTRERLQMQWAAVRSPNSPCTFAVSSADAPVGRTFFRQIPKNTPPNGTDHSSGCGPTAWMNLFGWHDLNVASELLAGTQQHNNPYVDGLTMRLHDDLGTHEPWWTFDADQGLTWPEDMDRGIEFAHERLLHSCDSWWRYDPTDEPWVFRVARDAMQRKRPFIVGYFSDWHYAIGYETKECTGHTVTIMGRAVQLVHRMIRIYDSGQDKWIPMDTIFGIWAAYDFAKLPSGSIGSEVVRYDWSAGWTAAEFYDCGGQTYLLTLKAGDGTVHVSRMNPDGTVGPRVDTRDWSSGYTLVKPFTVAANHFLFLLKSDSGIAYVERLNPNGSIGAQVVSYDWSGGWTTAEFFEVGGQTFLFTLKRESGVAHVNRMNSNGTVGVRVGTYDWSSGWSHVRSFTVGGAPYMLFLKQSTGVVHISPINPDGTIGANVAQYDWSSGWTTAEFYTMGGSTYLFLLKAGEMVPVFGGSSGLGGVAHVHKMNVNGTVGPMLDQRDWSDGWTTVKFFRPAGSPEQFALFLKYINGAVHITKVIP